MPGPTPIHFAPVATDTLAELAGRVVLLVSPEGKLDAAGRKANSLSRKAVARLIESPAFQSAPDASLFEIAWPVGMAAEALVIVKLPRKPGANLARKAGGAIAAKAGPGALTVLAPVLSDAPALAQGLALRLYRFARHKTQGADKPDAQPDPVTLQVRDPDEASTRYATLAAQAEGVHLARDLVNEPANVLTTSDFAARIEALREVGLEVEILDEAELAKIGMRLLLSVGQGSDSPTKVAILRWNGAAESTPPIALVGKGVVFDTGGISLKPGAGMWDMTMDMGGAATVVGTMLSLAHRKAAAHVVGLVGLVENMPSGKATRPGDIVESLKGDTVEILNTDAEGRLVLADLLWYAQERFAPAAVIDLATLTGAMLVALGTFKAGVFSNDDTLATQFLTAAEATGEGAWRLPLAPEYDKMLDSDKADIKNIAGTRDAGSIVAAQFLQRFVAAETPWIHLDIAGTASSTRPTDLAPKGATGWGVRALDHLVAQMQG